VDDPEDALLGATISSFKSVCIKPEPYVSFNLTQDSRTYKVIKEHKYFCISVPQNDVAGYRLARAFAYKNGKDALEADGDGGRIQIQHWPLAFEGGKPVDMKHTPPTVTMSGLQELKSNGLAFAFLCEYHDSVSAGDHVVVTGKLLPATIKSASPWGKDEDYGDIFASNDMTLAYVHGFFGNPEVIGGLDQSWKMDDRYATQSADKLATRTQRKAIEFFEKRLQIIEGALAILSGEEPPSHVPQTPEIARALLLSPERLLQYRKYYQNRLLEYRNVLKASVTDAGYAQSRPFTKPEMKEQKQKDKERTVLYGWKEAYVREKTLLSDAELENEETIYRARLEALDLSEDPSRDSDLEEGVVEHQGSYVPYSGSGAADSGGNASTISQERSSVAEAERRQRLIEHFEERLNLIRRAKKRKAEALVHPTTPKVRYTRMTNPETERHWENRFLGTKRSISLSELVKDYRLYQLQVTEARLARIQVLFQEGQYDDDVLVQLEERIAHYEGRLDLVAQVISEKYENPDPPSLSDKLSEDTQAGSDGKNSAIEGVTQKRMRNQTYRNSKTVRTDHRRKTADGQYSLQLEQSPTMKTENQGRQVTDDEVQQTLREEEPPSANETLDLKSESRPPSEKGKEG